MKVTYEKWLKSPFGTQGLLPENPRTRHIYVWDNDRGTRHS